RVAGDQRAGGDVPALDDRIPDEQLAVLRGAVLQGAVHDVGDPVLVVVDHGDFGADLDGVDRPGPGVVGDHRARAVQADRSGAFVPDEVPDGAVVRRVPGAGVLGGVLAGDRDPGGRVGARAAARGAHRADVLQLPVRGVRVLRARDALDDRGAAADAAVLVRG